MKVKELIEKLGPTEGKIGVSKLIKEGIITVKEGEIIPTEKGERYCNLPLFVVRKTIEIINKGIDLEKINKNEFLELITGS